VRGTASELASCVLLLESGSIRTVSSEIVMFVVIYIPDFFLQAASAISRNWLPAQSLWSRIIAQTRIVQLTKPREFSGVCVDDFNPGHGPVRENIIKPRSATPRSRGCRGAAAMLPIYPRLTSKQPRPEFARLDLKGQRSAGDEKFGRQIMPCWIRFIKGATWSGAKTPPPLLP